MQNQPTATDGGSKLNIPLNSQIYKIIKIDKEGFKVRLLNISTMAEQTVLHSRIKPLELSEMESLNLSQPELFDRLVKLRRQLRNMYVPGSHTNQELYQIPFHQQLASSETVPSSQEGEVEMEEYDSTGGGDLIINDEAGDEESGEQIEPNQLGPSFDHPELENSGRRR